MNFQSYHRQPYLKQPKPKPVMTVVAVQVWAWSCPKCYHLHTFACRRPWATDHRTCVRCGTVVNVIFGG